MSSKVAERRFRPLESLKGLATSFKMRAHVALRPPRAAQAEKHDYFFSSSMPFVALPGLVAQQNTELLPHFSQTCLTSFDFPLPVPTVVMVLLQPGHKCFAPTVITWICPFSVLTLCTITDLHFSQTIATASPGW